MERVWRESFRVRFYDADPGGQATLPALCRFLQVAADQHVRSFGASLTDLQATGRMWVLAELSLAIDTFPCIEEELTVETWAPARMGGPRAFRDYLILDAKGARVGAAASLWLILDAVTRHPLRLPAEFMAFRMEDREPAISERIEAPRAPESVDNECAVRAGWQDLDQNRHTNNVRYLEWALAAVPSSVWEAWQPCALTIRFHGEILPDQTVHSAVQLIESDGALEVRHRIHGDDDRTLALARTAWRRRPQ